MDLYVPINLFYRTLKPTVIGDDITVSAGRPQQLIQLSSIVALPLIPRNLTLSPTSLLTWLGLQGQGDPASCHTYVETAGMPCLYVVRLPPGANSIPHVGVLHTWRQRR